MTEAIRKLSLNDVAVRIGGWQEAYKLGKGPNRRAESLRLAAEVGARPDEVNSSWDDAELERVVNGFSIATPRKWSEVVVPKGATKLDALTYVPGLVGDVVRWTVACAPRPNRMMALGSALGVVGTVIGRHIMTPREGATHLFIAILLKSGWGKDVPLQCGAKLVELALGPSALASGQFASAPGLEEALVLEPRMISFADELGDELMVIKNQGGNPYVGKLTGLLKKLYNRWNTIITASTISRGKSKTILWPAFTIVGAATPDMFYRSFAQSDLESGFLNRWLVLPYAAYRRAPLQKTTASADRPPAELVQALKGLPQQPTALHRPADGSPPERQQVLWGAGAEDVYFAFSRRMDELQDGNQRRFELAMRTIENVDRLATIVAVGRGSASVDIEDIEWGIRLAELSLDTLASDISRYITEYVEFPQLCSKVWEEVWSRETSKPPHWISDRNLERRFARSLKYGNELARVKDQLQREQRLRPCKGRRGDSGPVTDGWEALRDDDDD